MEEALSLEVCPSCGELTEWLNDSTGWCQNCSVDFCSCGNEVPQGKKLCSSCSYDKFLLTNADALERYTAQGDSLETAKHKVLNENRSYCLCCHEPIKHGKNAFFCTQNVLCRKAKRRYRTLRERFEPDIALQLTVQEVLATYGRE